METLNFAGTVNYGRIAGIFYREFRIDQLIIAIFITVDSKNRNFRSGRKTMSKPVPGSE
jgi:hypothetical protein